LIRICEDHWRPFIAPDIPKKTMKNHWDRAFNSWDVFVQRLRDDSDATSKVWADLFGEYTYKKVFFDDPTFANMYKEIKE